MLFTHPEYQTRNFHSYKHFEANLTQYWGKGWHLAPQVRCYLECPHPVAEVPAFKFHLCSPFQLPAIAHPSVKHQRVDFCEPSNRCWLPSRSLVSIWRKPNCFGQAVSKSLALTMRHGVFCWSWAISQNTSMTLMGQGKNKITPQSHLNTETNMTWIPFCWLIWVPAAVQRWTESSFYTRSIKLSNQSIGPLSSHYPIQSKVSLP